MGKQLACIVLLCVSGVNSVRAANPMLVQHVCTSEDDGYGGNPFYINLPNLAGAGNTLILGMSFNWNGQTVTVSDDMTNKWTVGPSTPSSGSFVTRLYYATNVLAGTDKITVTFGGENAAYFQAVVSEFYNIAPASPADGSSDSTSSTAPTITAGSFTTTTPGDLLYFYGFDTTQGGSLTNFNPGSGCTLLSADNQWGSAAEYAIQALAAATNMQVSATAGSDAFNAVAMAFKAANQGTAPSGVHIIHVYHVYYQRNVPLQFPTSGNLLLVNTAFPTNETTISSIASHPNNTWTRMEANNNGPQICFATNAATSSTLTLTPTISSFNPPLTLVLYDVAGVTAYPYDSSADFPEVSTNNDNSQNILMNIPSITPVTNGIVIAVMSNTFGPSTNMAGAGQILDTVTYGGQVDSDTVDNSDGYAHYFNATAGKVGFDWKQNDSYVPEVSAGVAIAFNAADSQNIIALQITALAFSNNNFVVSLNTVLGPNYQLQGTTNLESGSWYLYWHKYSRHGRDCPARGH